MFRLARRRLSYNGFVCVGAWWRRLRFSDGNGSSAGKDYNDVTGTTNLVALPPTVTKPRRAVVGNGGQHQVNGGQAPSPISNVL